MKKILALTITFSLILSLLLSACNNNINEQSLTSADSSFEESVETTSNDVTSQVGTENSDITDETSETPDETSITEDSSIPQEESSEPKETSQSDISDIKHYDFEDSHITYSGWQIGKTHDYCYCGAESYTGYCYPFKMGPNIFDNFLVEYGYATKEELKELYDSFDEIKYKYDPIEQSEYFYTHYPSAYYIIKYFSLSKEDVYKFRDWQVKGCEEGWHDEETIFTDKEIEILCGDFSKETIMKELKDETAYYFEETLYSWDHLTYRVDDETFKRMLKDEYFAVYLIDIDKVLNAFAPTTHEKLFSRVETLKAEMENE